MEKASQYTIPFKIIEENVKPEREKQSDKIAREKWWLFMRARIQAYEKIRKFPRCFASARTTKHLIISSCPTHWLFSDALNFFITDRWDIYAVLQSTLHEVWARKYSGSLKQDLRYSPSKCFDTFAFPASLWRTPNTILSKVGEQYHEHRNNLMLSLWLGLTDIYNIFHSREAENDLDKLFATRTLKDPYGRTIPNKFRQNTFETTAKDAFNGIITLRKRHIDLDNNILAAYGWTDLDLNHNFYEIETLPENDRVRYTISPKARKEVLKRLLIENHRQAKAQSSEQPETKMAVKKKSSLDGTGQFKLKI